MHTTFDLEHQWQLADLFDSIDAWYHEEAQLKIHLNTLQTFQGTLHEAKQLFRCFSLQDQIQLRNERLYVYANMWHHEDTTLPAPQALVDRSNRMGADVQKMSAFVFPELLALPESELLRLSLDPLLETFQSDLEQLMEDRKHMLSATEEALLAQVGELSQAPSAIFEAINNADLAYPMIEDGQGELIELSDAIVSQLMESPDRELRKRAFDAVYETYDQFQHTFASTLAAHTKQQDFYRRIRKFDSALQHSLHDSEVPVSVYENLIQTIRDHLPLMHRYHSIRKALLGLSDYSHHDGAAPIGDWESPILLYEEAQQLVLESVKPLGKAYQQLVEESFRNRWIDVEERPGKYGGAYCWGAYGTHPYVLLNHQDNLDGAFTLTHELGHAMHSYYSDQKQPYRKAQYVTFNAEVASTCNEALLMHHLLNKTTDDRMKLYLLMHYADQFRGTVFRQTMFAEFEKTIHEMTQHGSALTAQTLGDVYEQLIRDYDGPDFTIDPKIRSAWARIPHFYTSFYVFQYATGFSAATSLAHQIITQGEPAVNRYLDFLASGCSNKPLELLKQAGVDLSTPKPIEEAMLVFSDILDQIQETAKRLHLM